MHGKLTDNRRKQEDRTYQFKICLWIALNKTTTQIRDLLKDRYEIEMSHQNINNRYRKGKKWQPIITYLRTRYLRNISRIPIADKVHRLTLLNEAAEEALTYHTKSINEWGTVEEKKIGILPSLIKEARAEVEGDKPGVVIDQSKHTHYVTHLHAIAKKEKDESASAASHLRGGLNIIE